MAAPAQPANWVYDKGTASASGGGTPDIPNSPPVTIDHAEVRDVYDGQQQIDVYWNKPAGATSDNFKGVTEYLEDPDLSAQPSAPMNGTVPLDGSAQLSGTWSPTLEQQTSDSPATIVIDGQAVDRTIRIYLASYGNAKNAVLVRANKAGATPNIVVSVPATAGKYVRGQEYALLVKNVSIVVVDDFDNPAGPQYKLNFFYDEPDPIPLPPGMAAFGGVQTVYEYPTGLRVQGTYLDAKKPASWVSDSYPAGGGGSFLVYFASADINQRVNTVVPGVTPVIQVDIVYPPDGTLTSPTVTDLAISPTRWVTQSDFTVLMEADLTWTPPDSARYAGVEFWRTDQLPPTKLGDAGDLLSFLTLEVIGYPATAQAWTVTAIAYDYNGKLSDDPNAPSKYSPSVVWNVKPPDTGNAPLVDASKATVAFTQEAGSDGVIRMTTTIAGWVNPTANTFGGVTIARVLHGAVDPTSLANAVTWDAALGATTLTTPAEPAPSARTWDFYFVSRDPKGVKNIIVPGTTPMITSALFTPASGQIIPSRIPGSWFDETEFQWPTGADFSALQIGAQKIFVGSILRVGGGSGTDAASFAGQANGQIAVYNSSNVLRAWMGEQDGTTTGDNPTPHTVYGGWFAELYVGGSGPPTAPLYATSQGVVIVGGIAAPSGGTYPYISIRDDTGLEVGRIGALIGGPGQGNSGPLVPTTDPAYIAGAWFTEFAVGGQSLADWRLLAAKDNTVRLRNINTFEIDWPANYPDANNPTNAATTLIFGYDAFHADNPGSQYWKFPGIQITRTGTKHGSMLLDRGLVVNGPNGRLGAFVSFNGDSFGSDTGTFWCDMAMISPVSGQQNVYLRSGNVNIGDAYFLLLNQNGVKMIEVTTAGGTAGAAGVIYVGGSLANYSTTLINSAGQFVGAGVLCPNNGIGAAGFNPWNGTQYLNGVTSTFKDQTGRTVTVTGGVITSIV
jgi:hypothetical protein